MLRCLKFSVYFTFEVQLYGTARYEIMTIYLKLNEENDETMAFFSFGMVMVENFYVEIISTLEYLNNQLLTNNAQYLMTRIFYF